MSLYFEQVGWIHSYYCQMTSSKAAKAEFAKEYDQAFRLYIKAAESFLHLSRSGGTQSDKIKQQLKANASKALERAERIKKFIEKSTPSSHVQSPSLRLSPVAINHFSPRKSLKSLRFCVFNFGSRGTIIRSQERRECQWAQLSFLGWSCSYLVHSTLRVSLLVHSEPCVLTMALQWLKLSTQTFTRPTKKFMHLETSQSTAGSIYRRTAPTNHASGHPTAHCNWLFCLCVNFGLPWTFSKIWVHCKSERLCSIAYLSTFRSLQYHPYGLLRWMADMMFGFCSMVHIVEWVLSFPIVNHIDAGIFLDR